MKWAVIVLVILGLVAAFSAALLVGALRITPATEGSSSSNLEVILAKTSLPAMTVITSEHITKDTASADALPEGYLTSPVHATGRVLAVPVVEGQVLTRACFVTDGSEAQLAAAIPYGMRAVTITLSGRGITGELLHPGCVVDVLASFSLRSQERNRGQALSTTLLNGIRVIAVKDATIVSQKDDKKSASGGRSTQNTNFTVTLMVDPRQAEALQLAMEYGRISLSLRNPLDEYPTDLDSTVLSEGRMAKSGIAMETTVLPSQLKKIFKGSERDNMRISTAGGANVDSPMETTSDQRWFDDVTGESQTYQSPRWIVTVIRAREVRDEELDIPESEQSSFANTKK
ncbi:MAG: Flp pilus assembly protein CpaB [Planctomycetota bacterium]|jgi:pilus assembly protein CpaB